MTIDFLLLVFLTWAEETIKDLCIFTKLKACLSLGMQIYQQHFCSIAFKQVKLLEILKVTQMQDLPNEENQ